MQREGKGKEKRQEKVMEGTCSRLHHPTIEDEWYSYSQQEYKGLEDIGEWLEKWQKTLAFKVLSLLD